MPPTIMVEESFLEQARDITQRTKYQGFDLITEDDENIELADIEGMENIFRNAITAKSEKIHQRIENNTPEDSGQRHWGGNDEQNQPIRFHIRYKDLSTIMQNANAVCPNCNALISRLMFTASVTEYGSAYITIENGIADHETDDSNNNDGYTYQCSECEGEVDTSDISYFIPNNSLTLLKQFCNEMLAVTNGTHPNPPQRENGNIEAIRMATNMRRTPTRDIFPAGEQVQKDIPLHGPNGPQMRSNEKGISMTSPEDFIFRNNKGWICKACSTHNSGQSKNCQECREGKYTPTKNIKLTL